MKNREIKFRGLSEDGWVYGYYVKHGSAATIESPVEDRHNLVHVVKPETVGQQLKENLWEGDIIRFSHPHTVPEREWTAVVIWDDENYRWGLKREPQVPNGFVQEINDDILAFCTVIDNIWEGVKK